MIVNTILFVIIIIDVVIMVVIMIILVLVTKYCWTTYVVSIRNRQCN